jgi:hypothetical protein
LTDAELDAQMDEIGKEEIALIAELGGRIVERTPSPGTSALRRPSWRISENGSTSRSRGSRSAGLSK